MYDVLFVGSIHLSDARTVFDELSNLAPFLKRAPDGETGERSSWTQWQHRFLSQVDGLEVVSVKPIQGGLNYPQFRLKQGRQAADLKFGSLGYADVALQSYKEFCAARSRGKFKPGTRFQVSLPTPFAVVVAFFVTENVIDIWPAYERALFAEVDTICDNIPHEDLAIQWDVACEIHRVLERPGVAAKYPVVDGVIRAIDTIPDDVEAGVHLCYGDPGHKHIIEPRDTGLMVTLANEFAQRARRACDWIHMPVPRDRDDDAYFAPLADLRLPATAELYLGLIHLTDGIDGTRRRIAAARKVVDTFGIATECGFGRRPPETIHSLLALHRQVASGAL